MKVARRLDFVVRPTRGTTAQRESLDGARAQVYPNATRKVGSAAIASRDTRGAIRTERIGLEQELGEYVPTWAGGLAWEPFRQQQ